MTISDTNITRNSHYLKHLKPLAKSVTRCNFLPNRINDMWNKLSATSRESPNLLTFKKSVEFELTHLKYDYYF